MCELENERLHVCSKALYWTLSVVARVLCQETQRDKDFKGIGIKFYGLKFTTGIFVLCRAHMFMLCSVGGTPRGTLDDIDCIATKTSTWPYPVVLMSYELELALHVDDSLGFGCPSWNHMRMWWAFWKSGERIRGSHNPHTLVVHRVTVVEHITMANCSYRWSWLFCVMVLRLWKGWTGMCEQWWRHRLCTPPLLRRENIISNKTMDAKLRCLQIRGLSVLCPSFQCLPHTEHIICLVLCCTEYWYGSFTSRVHLLNFGMQEYRHYSFVSTSNAINSLTCV